MYLQETWHLDDNIQYFNKIHTDYLFTAISGVNSKVRILPGRPKQRNKLAIQKETLARNINKSRVFWTELKKINPTSKVISSSIGSANGSTEITKLFYNKYRSLYSSVPTDDNELREIHDVINSRLSTSTHTTVTPDIIKQCIHKLKPRKDDGDLGF